MPNQELLLIPGPTPVVDEIYEALASETWAHTDPRFAAIFKHSIQSTKKMFHVPEDGEVYIFAGSGTLAMEMAIVNTVGQGEKLLVISHGYFGDRFTQLAKAYGIEIETIQSEWGTHVDPELVANTLQHGNFKAVTITHVDTSTGVMSDLECLVPIVKKSGALFILDGVCASAAIEENLQKEYGSNKEKIDVILTASQKAIGVPPGLGIVAFGPQALDAHRKLKNIPAYFLNIANWRPIMDDPTKYFATPPVNMIYAYDKGMQLIFNEGLSKRYQRHHVLGQAMRAALQIYQMTPLALEEVAAPTLSCMLYPVGLEDVPFRKSLAEKGLVVAGALAHLAGKAFRIGHMGNTTESMFLAAIEYIGSTLHEFGLTATIDEAQNVFQSIYHETAKY